MELTTGASKRMSYEHLSTIQLVNLTDSPVGTIQKSLGTDPVQFPVTTGAPKNSILHLPKNQSTLSWNDDTDIPNGKCSERWCIESSDCCLRCPFCCECNWFCQPCRRCVSTNKVRWEKEGFSIDLTYISPRVITHGFPAAGAEHLYRNPRYMVKRFLEEKHGAHYHVFNFCAEPGRCYPKEVFDGRIRRFPFRDHQVPRLYVLHQFVECAVAWLAKDTRNVCALHCKAGKGRAGVMACCLLLRIGFKKTAGTMIAHYDKTRVTMNKKSGRQHGLTVPSQLRFVAYYERILRQAERGTINPALLGNPTPRTLHLISLENGPTDCNVNCSLYQQVGFVGDKVLRWSGNYAEINATHKGWFINEGRGIELTGNFEVVFTKDSPSKQKEKRIGYTWLNTSLMKERDTIVLNKSEIDKFHKDRKHKKYSSDLKVTLHTGEYLENNPMVGKGRGGGKKEA
jgi:phosphatidylinositol-3,4,5-trisphosphate 3-phosphatase/dual-specificity protein phosphatase PTEN